MFYDKTRYFMRPAVEFTPLVIVIYCRLLFFPAGPKLQHIGINRGWRYTAELNCATSRFHSDLLRFRNPTSTDAFPNLCNNKLGFISLITELLNLHFIVNLSGQCLCRGDWFGSADRFTSSKKESSLE